MINMVLIQNPLAPFCCVFGKEHFGKDTLRQFPLLWWSWQAVLDFSYIFIKLQADSNILPSPEADRGNCLPYVLAPPSVSCESGGWINNKNNFTLNFSYGKPRMCMKNHVIRTRNGNCNLKKINKITKTRCSLKKRTSLWFRLYFVDSMPTNLKQQWSNDTLPFLVFDWQ